MDKKLLKVPRATFDIYNYKEGEINIYEFDATECSAPEPMVNTIVALQLLKNVHDRLQVLYFHEPTPLFERISSDIFYALEELETGDVLVIFRRKECEIL